MITVSHRARMGGRVGTLLALAVLVGACGSSGHPGAAAAAPQKTCEQVSAVLSDGPDPDVDPVGYAQAQILPLRQIHASDPALGKAVATLADAYSSFVSASGSSAAKSAVASATRKINSICPGAAS